jgi:hypothetical protein
MDPEFNNLTSSLPQVSETTSSVQSYALKVETHTDQVSKLPVTEAEYCGLQQAYEHMNKALFSGELPDVMITMQRKPGSYGYFHADRFSWRNSNDAEHRHEIALNPDAFINRTNEQIVSTLVHEQCHVWEELHGTASKRHYHNRIWAQKMIDIGLMPSHTGGVGGRITGSKMSHYILPNGLFAEAFVGLAEIGWRLNLQSAPHLGREGASAKSKTRFTCPACGQNAWGKPDLCVICGHCTVPMVTKSGTD